MSGGAYVQRGFGLKADVAPILARDYDSAIVDHLRAHGHAWTVGDVTIRLATEFGFCYGVDRAVDYAYEARAKFPDRRIFLTGEIIHNPHVNSRLREMGVCFLTGPGAIDGGWDALRPEDVVLLPAFGVTVDEFERLEKLGVVMVDTTCGSVLNVWKTVRRYALDGYTSVIHGKYWHEETRATASQAVKHGGAYLVVFDLAETDALAAFVRTGAGADALARRFEKQVSPGFDFRRHFERVGLANQTTMLSSESLEVAERLRRAFADRAGTEAVADRFRSFETICSATQERQDAVVELVRSGVDLMIVIGGYNSSNTSHLAAITATSVPTFHIHRAESIVDAQEIRHKPVGAKDEIVSRDWLPARGPLTVGFTAGASTPNHEVGKAVTRLLDCRGLSPRLPLGSAPPPSDASVPDANPAERRVSLDAP